MGRHYGMGHYGMYGLGQDPAAAQAGAEVEYRAAITLGVPVVTGLVGVAIGFFIGFSLARRR